MTGDGVNSHIVWLTEIFGFIIIIFVYYSDR